MQPRNIEVFDGLRITTDHIDHLQGSIHSAIADLRGILGLSRIHRGFGVTAVDEHSVRVDPGLAFDAHGRRVVSDEPVTLEIPAATATTRQFVCVAYDQGADGEVEGHLTRIWDAARVDIRPAPPAIADDAIVIAVLEPTESGEGFTVQMAGADQPVETGEGASVTDQPTASEPAQPNAQPAPPSIGVRSGLFLIPDTGIDRAVVERMASAIRAGVTSGAPVAFTERLRSEEAFAGVVIASLALDVAARLWSKPADDGGGAASSWWRAEAAGHGQARVNDDGAFTQFGSAVSSCSWSSGQSDGRASFTRDAAFSLRSGVPVSAEATAGDAWLAGLRLALRCAPRNGDGFAIDASLEWEGQASDAIAAWLEAWTGSMQWMAEGGWTAIGAPTSATTTPGG